VVTPASTGLAVPVIVVEPPLQIDEAAEVKVTTGNGLIRTEVVEVAEAHGAVVTV
jgi:hypothetical protein